MQIINQWLNEEYARGNVNLKLGSEEFDKIVAKKLKDHDWLFLRTDAQGDQVGWQRLVPK